MKVTKQHLITLIKELDGNIDELLKKILHQDNLIDNLKKKNIHLQNSNQKTLDQIKDYVKELETIRAHYVNSNNQSK